MAKPIFKRLLLHNAEYYFHKDIEKDDNGNEVFGDVHQLTNVRFEPSSKLIITQTQEEVTISSVLFIDAFNSSFDYTPVGQLGFGGPQIEAPFDVDDRIKWMNTTFAIVTVEPLWDEKGLHHYELGLV